VVESLVIEKKGKLVALVHFNREELELKLKEMTTGITNKIDEKMDFVTKKVDDAVDDLIAELQQHINSRVNKFSKIQLLVAYPDPFQKTATQKIKRYLYV
jgi:long-chain acyl-CoA synthetase